MEWSDRVYVSDECKTGVAVCYALWGISRVKAVGEVSERWRYKGSNEALRPRDHALDDANLCSGPTDSDPFSDPSTVLPLGLSILDVHHADFVLNPEFNEIPSSFLHQSAWSLAFAYQTKRDETIHVPEGKGKLGSATHALRSSRNFYKKHLLLGDNLVSSLHPQSSL